MSIEWYRVICSYVPCQNYLRHCSRLVSILSEAVWMIIVEGKGGGVKGEGGGVKGEKEPITRTQIVA